MSIRRAQDERLEGTPDGLNAISEIMDVPDAPTIGTATDNGNLGASVTFTAAVTGGTATSYTVTSTPGSLTGTGSSSPITVTGLTGGTAYTFKVTGTNATGVTGAESSASNSVTPLFPVVGAYDSLYSVTLSGSATSVTFSNIPAGYKHLQLRIFGRTDRASSVWDTATMRFNNDSGTNYSWHYIYGEGTTTGSSAVTSTTGIAVFRLAATSASSNVMGVGVIDVLDYSSTTKAKTMRNLGGVDSNGSGEVSLVSGAWYNSASSITSITLTPGSGTNFLIYSQFALYGVK